MSNAKSVEVSFDVNCAVNNVVLCKPRLIQFNPIFPCVMRGLNNMKFRTLEKLDRALRKQLVVSCQPVDNGPMDRSDIVLQLALAACLGGAGAVRVEGAVRVAKVCAAFADANANADGVTSLGASAVPIIGIIKRDLADSPVRITPHIDDVIALSAAGADVIAVDGTDRIRPATRNALLMAIRECGALAMADCANVEDAFTAHEMGFDIVGTTLSGYTGGVVPAEPDYDLVKALSGRVPRLMAEGRFNRPDQARRAIELGAWAVTVGTAITRTEVVTSWFADAVRSH
jgi:N-acylglucosamine-6-phosphate 2-epimerase